MNGIVFKPKYGSFHPFAIIGAVLLEALVLFELLIAGHHDLLTILSAVFFTAVLSLYALGRIHRIRFGKKSLAIDRFLLRPKVIDYSDVLDIGVMSVKTRRYNIPLQLFKNSNELRAIFKQLVTTGSIKRSQLEGHLVAQEVKQPSAQFGALLVGTALVLGLQLVADTFGIWPHLSQELSAMLHLGLIITIYTAVFWYMTRTR